MKSVLISIQPKWCEKIANGEKTIELRKSRPKIETPFKCYIYATKSGDRIVLKDDRVFEISKALTGKVIGEFICNKVDEYKYDYGCGYYPGDGVDIDDDTILETTIDREDINIYAKGKTLYGWHISDLKIYDKPKELSKFKISCNRKNFCYSCNRFTGKPWDICNDTITRPPQSYMFVEEILL